MKEGSKGRARSRVSGTQHPDEDSEEEEELAEEDLRKDTKAPRIMDRVKAETVHHNEEYEKLLKDREQATLVNLLRKNREAVAERSAEVAARPENVRRHAPRDISFLEGVETFLYSGQKLNSAELQKSAMRAEMEKTIHNEFFSYCEEFNSGLFGIVNTENIMRIEDTLRQVTPGANPIPFRYPKTRTLEAFVRAGVDWQDISDARKDELRTAWVEEQTGTLARGQVIPGAFDPRSLSKGNKDIIALRRTGLDPGGTAEMELAEQERTLEAARTAANDTDSKVKIKGEDTNAQAEKKFVVQEKMRFVNSASGGGYEKYTTQILQDPPASRGIRFDKRKPPDKIEKEFGKSKRALPNLVPLPPSIFIAEDHKEYPNETGLMGQMCAKSVLPGVKPREEELVKSYNPGVLGVKSSYIWKGPPVPGSELQKLRPVAPLTAREKEGSQKWRRPPLSAR